MKYCDLHCDALTKTEGAFQVTGDLLRTGGCALQCFAAFLPETEGRFRRALQLCEKFGAMCEREGYLPAVSASDLREGNVCAMLTVEGGGAVEGELGKLEELYRRGVRLMTLTWNFPNEIGFPAFPDYRGLSLGHGTAKERETVRGLTGFGRQCVERMGELGMIVDVSHGSDALFFDVAAWSRRRGIPFVASHSAADAVHCCARNLTDAQIRTLADCGGVVGLCFCAAFLSDDAGAAAQRKALLAHARHILRIGGEDVLALGSDFDGIPQNAYMQNAAMTPALLSEFAAAFGERTAEKIAFANFERVFAEVGRRRSPSAP